MDFFGESIFKPVLFFVSVNSRKYMKSDVYKPDPNHIHIWFEIWFKSDFFFSV